MHRTQAVFLDAGFTLIQLTPPWQMFFLQVTRSQGLELTAEDARRAYRAAHALFEAHYFQPNQTWTQDDRILDFWREYFRAALEQVPCPPDRLLPCGEALAITMNDPVSWQPYPEVAEVLAQLKAAGYTVGILSDWTSWLPQILERLGLLQYTDLTVVSAREGVAKPHPDFYALALERSGVPADQALMVGDSAYADIEGAARMGIRGVLIDRGCRHDDYPGPVIHHLDELWPHLGPPR